MNFHRNYAIILFYNERWEILFQDRRNHFKPSAQWGCFGGGLEAWESFEEALVREVKEELNLDISDDYTYIGTTIFTLVGEGTQETRIYITRWNTEYEAHMQVLEGAGAEWMTKEVFSSQNTSGWSKSLISMLEWVDLSLFS